MSTRDWLTVGWLVCGVAVGLVAANCFYANERDPDRGFVAAAAFVVAVVGFPIVAGIGVVVLVLWAGGWLLPARRREVRERCERERRADVESARAEIDKLHGQVGLPPVDWDAAP